MIIFIFLFVVFNTAVIGQRDSSYTNEFVVDNRRQFLPGYVCNYEIHFVPNLNFLLYTCVHESKCNSSHAGYYTWERRNPQLELTFDNCRSAFFPPPEGGSYVCCSPQDNEEVPDKEKNKTLAFHVQDTMKYVPGFRSAYKCKDYKTLACLGTDYCPSSRRRQNLGPSNKGGIETDIGKYPHLVLLGWFVHTFGHGRDLVEQEWYCLGSIVSESHILTSAGCRSSNGTGYEQFMTHARAGETEFCLIDVDCKPLKTRQLVLVHVNQDHPRRKPNYYYHDLMVVSVTGGDAFRWSSKVRPACLFNKLETYVETGGMFAFYESETKNGVTRNTTHEYEIQMYSVIGCYHEYHSHDRLVEPKFIDKDILFCAGLPHAGRTPCKGDYGGALNVDNELTYCTWNIYGVMAYAPNLTCGGSSPPIFVRVPYYIDWLEDILWYDMNMFKEFDTCSGSCKDTLSAKRNTLGRCNKYA